MNRQLYTQLNLLRTNLYDRGLEKQTKQRLTHDYHTKHQEIRAGGRFCSCKKIQKNKILHLEALLKELVLFQVKFSFSAGEVIRIHQDQIRIRTDRVPTSQADNENRINLLWRRP